MHENKIAKLIVNSAFKIHDSIGPGLLESVYEKMLDFDLRKQGCYVEVQKAMPVYVDQERIELGFRADLIVNRKVIVEIKSVESIAPVHLKQLRTYLILADLRLGLLVNFNVGLIKDGIRRVVNNL